MSPPVKKRPYTSPLRAEQAAATRLRILESARELFEEQGYPATTLGQVAEAAGVAADTVLHIFGSKRGLLSSVLDVTIGGDDQPIQVLDREGPQALRRETDQRRQIAMFAAGMTDQLDRVRPMDDILRSAAASDGDARALREDLQLRQRHQAMRQIASWIHANGEFKNDMTVEQAADIIWTLTSPEVHRLLRHDRQWTPEQYRAWLHETLETGLLA